MAKISLENFLNKLETRNLKENIFLFFGNEGGLIASLTKKVFNYCKKQKGVEEILYLDQKSDKKSSLDLLLKNNSLFSNIKFIVVKNPSENFYKELENSTLSECIIIINGEGIKTTSKLKKIFDRHEKFISVACYKLNKSSKAQIINQFIKKNNLNIEKNTFWYLVENIDDNFLILEKELEKISIYNSNNLTIEELKKILTTEINTDLDEIFFKCAGGDNSSILKSTNVFIRSSSECYEVLRSVKKFAHILSLAVVKKNNKTTEELANAYLPRYLFMQKNTFKEILEKTNFAKVLKIIKLIQKTETLLRKNNAQAFEITQRFLLNFSKIIR